MFEWLFGKDKKNFEEEVRKSFSAIRNDMDVVGKWIKHLDGQDKELFNLIHQFKQDLSTIKEDAGELREQIELIQQTANNKQVFKKRPILYKQTGVLSVDNVDQTAVQTANFYDIFRNLSVSERALLFTVMNSEMKLSYEDLALLLGKERSTIRGQINTIKQKNDGLFKEVTEKNGKKRVFVPEEIKEKLSKYAKVRVGKTKKEAKNDKNE